MVVIKVNYDNECIRTVRWDCDAKDITWEDFILKLRTVSV